MKLRFIAALAMFAGTALAHPPEDTGLPFDRYTWVTTHNAFTAGGFLPNQGQTIDKQLAAGVRGLMLDLHPYKGRVHLCHGACSAWSEPFADLINDVLLPFLEEHPDEILTLHLEDYTSRAELAAELERAPGLVGKTFDPYAWPTPEWPTYDEMLARGQRILIFDLERGNSGAIFTRAGAVHVMASEEFTVENYWSLGSTILQHDNRCYSRWEGRSLAQREIRGMPGWRPLFTMNQFHGVPFFLHSDNAFDTLLARYRDHCWPAAGRKPNYVAVDYHERGDVDRFVDWLNARSDGAP